jgi:tRNA(Ile)-lysidine synthase
MADAPLTCSDLDDQLTPLLDAPRWYVGFSGGIDSTVLLHLLCSWCRRNPGAPPLAAIHVNHGLHPAAGVWQQHCEWVCRLLQLPLSCHAAEVLPSTRGLEDAARTARYGLFGERLQAGEVLFLGHHADDQVETFFLRLMRGAGVRGLAAIPASRALGRGRLVRPLLQLPRARLEQYASAHELQGIEDPSNSDTSLDRNFLRRDVLPLLATRWPGYRQTVSRASGHIAAAADLLERAVPAPPTLYSAMGDPGVALAQLDLDSPQEAALALRHWLQRAGLPAPDQAALAEFLRQLGSAGAQSRPLLQCSAYALQRYRDALYLLPPLEADDPAQSLFLSPGEVCQLPAPGGRYRLDPVPADGLRLAPGECLELAWRRGGERCRPRGRAGSAGLKKLLQEQNVPPWWRDRVPLLYLAGELLAVGDLWLCQSSRWAACPAPGESLWQPRWERNITTAFD